MSYMVVTLFWVVFSALPIHSLFFFSLSPFLSVTLSFSLLISLSLCVSLFPHPVSVCVCLSVCLSILAKLLLSLFMFLCLSVRFSVSLPQSPTELFQPQRVRLKLVNSSSLLVKWSQPHQHNQTYPNLADISSYVVSECASVALAVSGSV